MKNKKGLKANTLHINDILRALLNLNRFVRSLKWERICQSTKKRIEHLIFFPGEIQFELI